MSTNRFDLTAKAGTSPTGATLLYVSSAKYGGDWHSTPHTHRCTELFYVVGGKGRFRIGDEIFPVGADDLVVVNPLVQHTEVSLDANPLEYVVLGVEGLELSAQGHGDRFCIVNFRGLGEDILVCLRIMLREIEGKQPGYETICQNLLEVFLVRLQRQIHYAAALITPPPASKESAAVRWYIDSHFKENITLDLLAQVAHVNKFHMAHAFREEYGISPIKYLNQKRIEESRYLLRTTDLSLSRIAQMLGFSSSSYFSQSFRRHQGISPMAYREQHQRQGD